MTQNTQKNTQTWSKKHTEFCAKYRINSVLQRLWQWLLTLPLTHGKIEFNFNDFQKYVKRLRGRPHTKSHVKHVFNKLVFLRIIHIDKIFDNEKNAYRIELRHPSAVIPKKRVEKNLHYHQINLKTEGSNDCHSSTPYNSSSTLINNENSPHHTDNVSSNNPDQECEESSAITDAEKKRRLAIIQICAKYGILFNPKKATTEQLYKYTYWEVQQALNTFEKRNKTSPIDNPQGWIIQCLRYKFYEDFNYSRQQFIADITEEFFNISNGNKSYVT